MEHNRSCQNPFSLDRVWFLCLLFMALLPTAVSAQGFNEDKTALANFLKRMYAVSIWMELKVVDDYDRNYHLGRLASERGLSKHLY